MVKVSIIVPVYNVEEYLPRCLDSLINQTLSDIEIIIVNDGSKDNSQKIIDKYKKKDKRIISLIKENGGQSSARNYGFKYASGEYIGYVDSDDWVSPNMYEEMYNIAKKNNDDIVICDFYNAYDDGKLINMSSLIEESDDIIKGYIMSNPCPWNKIYKKELLNDKYFPEGMIYEDYASNPLLAIKLKKVEYLKKRLYYYYIRDNSTMRISGFNDKFNDILKASKIITEKINTNIEYHKYFEEYEALIIDNLLRDTYFRLKENKKAKKLLKDITLFIKDNYPKFMKNKYIKSKGVKYRIITYLIYKRNYKLLNLISRRK